MKSLLTSALLSLIILPAAMAQDVIVQRDGNIIMGKVLEINNQTISYKKADNPDGPLYSLKAEELLSIRFENGTQENFQQVADNADSEDADESNFALQFRPEIRLRLDAPCSDHVDGGGGVMGVAGVQINRSLIIGPGFGMIGHNYYNEDLYSFEFPVFIQARAMIPSKLVSPYVIGQVGYSFGSLDDYANLIPAQESDRLGMFASLGVGFRMKLKRGSLFMDLTWNAQQWRSSQLDSPTTFGICGGYFFERRH